MSAQEPVIINEVLERFSEDEEEQTAFDKSQTAHSRDQTDFRKTQIAYNTDQTLYNRHHVSRHQPEDITDRSRKSEHTPRERSNNNHHSEQGYSKRDTYSRLTASNGPVTSKYSANSQHNSRKDSSQERGPSRTVHRASKESSRELSNERTLRTANGVSKDKDYDSNFTARSITDHFKNRNSERRNSSRSPDTSRHKSEEPKTSKYKTMSPDTLRHNSRSPDTARHKTRSPDISIHKTRSPDTSRHKVQSPGTSRHNSRSPDNLRHKVRSPDTSRHNPRSPDTSRHKVRSPDISRHNPRSPDISRHKGKSPDTSRHNSRSPDTSRHKIRSPDTSRHKVRSPDTSRHTPRSPDTSGYKTGSPKTSRHNAKSTGSSPNGPISISSYRIEGERRSRKDDSHIIKPLTDEDLRQRAGNIKGKPRPNLPDFAQQNKKDKKKSESVELRISDENEDRVRDIQDTARPKPRRKITDYMLPDLTILPLDKNDKVLKTKSRSRSVESNHVKPLKSPELDVSSLEKTLLKSSRNNYKAAKLKAVKLRKSSNSSSPVSVLNFSYSSDDLAKSGQGQSLDKGDSSPQPEVKQNHISKSKSLDFTMTRQKMEERLREERDRELAERAARGGKVVRHSSSTTRDNVYEEINYQHPTVSTNHILIYFHSPQGDKMSKLIHTYAHKFLRKIKMFM